ncbi:MAG: DUF4838 domain-containing protein [Candidatus Nanoarchaeia archaeon]
MVEGDINSFVDSKIAILDEVIRSNNVDVNECIRLYSSLQVYISDSSVLPDKRLLLYSKGLVLYQKIKELRVANAGSKSVSVSAGSKAVSVSAGSKPEAEGFGSESVFVGSGSNSVPVSSVSENVSASSVTESVLASSGFRVRKGVPPLINNALYGKSTYSSSQYSSSHYKDFSGAHTDSLFEKKSQGHGGRRKFLVIGVVLVLLLGAFSFALLNSGVVEKLSAVFLREQVAIMPEEQSPDLFFDSVFDNDSGVDLIDVNQTDANQIFNQGGIGDNLFNASNIQNNSNVSSYRGGSSGGRSGGGSSGGDDEEPIDTTPPATITNLRNITTETTWILWNWTNPADEDFNKTKIYLNGQNTVFLAKPINEYNATGLTPNTSYTLIIQTIDHSGNINTTNITNIAITKSAPATCTDGILNNDETGIDCGGTCEACPKYLVQNNEGFAEIIISSTAPNMVGLAADDLQEYIEKMTGATLPINTLKNESIQYHIYVGQSNYTDALGITDEGCEFDSFKMVSGEDYLVLLGNDDIMNVPEPYTKRWSSETETVRAAWDNITNHTWESPYILHLKNYNPTFDIWQQDGRGSINAVSEFLYLQGVRWYHPGEIGEVVPIKDDILLPVVNRHVVPDFKMREMWMYSHQFLSEISSTDYLKWQLRLRLNSGDDSIGANRGHGIDAVTSRVGVNLAHPEFYAIWEGIRMDGTNNTDQKQDLCSEELLNENIAYVRAVFDHYDAPGEKIMPADGFTRVSESSQECIDRATPERGSGGELSDYVWAYVNNVAEAVYDTYPDKKIVGGAYTTYLLPPLTIDQFSPNVVVGMARWRSHFSDPETKELYRNLTYAWLEKLPSGKVYTGDYYLHNEPDRDYVGIPVYFPQIISDDLKFLNGKSLGEFIEVSTTASHLNLSYDANAANSLNIYMTARLYWNSSEDIDDLLDEYYELYYGPASSEMKEFVEYSENNLNTMLSDPGVLLNLRAMGNNARVVAGDTIYGERIDLLLKFMNATYIGEYKNISSCQTLISPSTTYKLTTDVSSTGTCFTISTLNVTIDCQGHKITYSTAGLANTFGVYSSYDHANIINCVIIDGNLSSVNAGRSGIYFDRIDNGLIKNNTVNTSSNTAIIMLGSSNILLQLNRVYVDSSVGIYSYSSTDLTLENNEGISNSNYGIYMYGSDNSLLWNNTGRSTSSVGIYVSSSSNVSLVRNTANSSTGTGIYLYNSLYTNLNSNTGTSTINGVGINVYGNSSGSVLVDNIGRSTTGNGIYISTSSANLTLTGNEGISNSNRGIMVESSYNTLTNNIGTSTANSGIYVQSTYNILTGNIGMTNVYAGISIQGDYAVLTGNVGISNGSAGIEVYSDNNVLNSNSGHSNYSSGIFLSSSSNNILTNNIGTSNFSYGLYVYNSNNNRIEGQSGVGYLTGSRGISLLSANNNMFIDCRDVVGTSNDVYILTSTNNTFINCSYDISKESVNGVGNYLVRKWYFDSSVRRVDGNPVGGANVSVYDLADSLVYFSLTNGSGKTNRTTIIEYVNTGGSRVFSTPHELVVNEEGYFENVTSYNISVLHNVVSSVTLYDSGQLASLIQGNVVGSSQSSKKTGWFSWFRRFFLGER